MTYLGDRPRLVNLQEARRAENIAAWELRRTPWWRRLPLWRRWMVLDARVVVAWSDLTDQDWDAIAVEEIRHVADRYWDEHGLDGNPFHPRGEPHVDMVAAVVAQRPGWELRVNDRRLSERLTPERAASLYRTEISRLQEVAADPVILAHDGSRRSRRRDDDDPGLRALVVQHQASSLRARFTYGGRKHAEVGWVESKTYTIDSIDPDLPKSDFARGSAWRAYAGLGIGTALYTHAGELLPEMRWADNSVSPYGQALRRKLHGLDPWRWQLRRCRCEAEWDGLTRAGASPCRSR